MRFHTVLKLGPNREVTPDGFTVFRNVSVSRTGWQAYGAAELPGIESGPDGLIQIFRDAKEVFRAETLASCNGKSLVIEHPEEDVSPANWRLLTNGFMVDARRGSGDQKDECVTDVFVTTPEALAEIDSGMREVSLGYDADYFVLGPGRAEQRNIIVNHIALVEAGRCGSRCAVRDHANQQETEMKFWDQLMAAISAKDTDRAAQIVIKARDAEEKEAEEKEKKEKEESEVKDKARDQKLADSLKSISDSLPGMISKAVADCMKEMKDEAEKEEGKKEEEKKKAEDKAKDEEEEKEIEEEAPDSSKAKDSAPLEESFNAVKSAAEIIAPGVKFPTFDRAASPRKTFKDCICGLRRTALAQGLGDATTAGIITSVRGKAIDAAGVGELSCRDTRSLFNGVVAVKKLQNSGTMSAAVTDNKTDDANPMTRFLGGVKQKYGKK